MESGFHTLDAAGFLEIWQHFDADGEDSWSIYDIFSPYIERGLLKLESCKFTFHMFNVPAIAK